MALIEDVIALDYDLVGTGRYRHCVQHDSLVIDTQRQLYFWNSRLEIGNVYDWCIRQRKMNPQEIKQFLGDFRSSPKAECPVVIKNIPMERVLKYHKDLLKNKEAMDWWENRGVTIELCKRFLLGFKSDHRGFGPASTIPIIQGGKVATVRNRIWYGDRRYMPDEVGMGHHLFNASVLQNEEAVIIEGEIKALVAIHFGENAAGLSGILLLPESELEHINAKRIWIVPDPIINSKKTVSPYDISWVQKLALKTEVRIVRLFDKFDDMVNKGMSFFRAYLAMKDEAKIVTVEDVMSAIVRKKRGNGTYYNIDAVAGCN